ncbi:hypothetical protein QTP86_004105 [Hemibagrus guttatus]|nr:hypothetical protein QTP86_004105 [Hemibagrus guttatus]
MSSYGRPYSPTTSLKPTSIGSNSFSRNVATIRHQRRSAPRIGLITLAVHPLHEHYHHRPSVAPHMVNLADDIFLANEQRTVLEEAAWQWHDGLEGNGLHLTTKKMEYMDCSPQNNGNIRVSGAELKKVQQFKYLSSVICSEGESLPAARGCVNAAWEKWRQVTGVMYDNLYASSRRFIRPWSSQSPCMAPNAEMDPAIVRDKC